MRLSFIHEWIINNPLESAWLAIVLAAFLFSLTRNGVMRGLQGLAARSKTKTDDILIKHLKPNRLSWLVPLGFFYGLAAIVPEYSHLLNRVLLFFILWLTSLTLHSLMNAVNEIYESRPNYNGVSIQSYLDLVKILIILVAIILTVSLFSGESPVVLLTGLGALTTVLLLIFQNTILSIVASIQMVANDMIKEGDWIEVPDYGADGDVVNVSLHSIRVQNFDMTFSVIPTYKMVDVSFNNWRGMKEAGGRRIERPILVDMTTIKFCDQELLKRLQKIDLIGGYVSLRIEKISNYHAENPAKKDSPLDGPQVTNLEAFREYISAYLRNRSDIHQEALPFLVRTLEPRPDGLPLELYVFTRTTVWEEYEHIQSEIFDNLLAAASHFDLRVFQQPTGMDFNTLARSLVTPKELPSN